jgi:hypothetical protein
MIGLLVEKKYAGFKPVLDNFIQTQFNGTVAFKHLMSCLKQMFDEIDQNPSRISKILPTLKVYIE